MNPLTLIGGTIIVVVGLFAILYLALQEPERTTLTDYCAENPDRCIVQGDSNAPVTVIEVSDYGCPHCRDFNLDKAAQLEQMYVETGDVKWVVLPFALREETTPAAESAMCAAEQDRFVPYHSALFALQDSPIALSSEAYQLAAANAGIPNIESFTSCLNSHKYRSIIQENSEMAYNAGLEGTPTFFVNDFILRGNVDLSVFQQRIEMVLNN